MAGSNNFKVFDENANNIQTDAEYLADTQRTAGVVPGIAPSKLHNKLYRQVSIMTAAIGEFIKNIGNAASDADFAALVTAITNTFASKPAFDTHIANDVRHVNYAADAGASDSYAITLSPVPTSYTIGMQINFKANTANTGAATLNCNALGAKTIKKKGTSGVLSDLVTGDIAAGDVVSAVYDGTYFVTDLGLGSHVAETVSQGGLLDINLATVAVNDVFTVSGLAAKPKLITVIASTVADSDGCGVSFGSYCEIGVQYAVALSYNTPLKFHGYDTCFVFRDSGGSVILNGKIQNVVNGSYQILITNKVGSTTGTLRLVFTHLFHY